MMNLIGLTSQPSSMIYRHHESSIAVDHLSRRGVRSGSGVPPLGLDAVELPTGLWYVLVTGFSVHVTASQRQWGVTFEASSDFLVGREFTSTV